MGNEATSIHNLPVSPVAAVVRSVQAAVAAAAAAAVAAGRPRLPSPEVGTTHIGAHLLAATADMPTAALARELDVPGVQIQPHSSGADMFAADGSGAVLDLVAAVAAAHPGKDVALSETGFPTRGPPWRAPPGGGNTTATPSVAAAAAYVVQIEAALAKP